MITGPECRGERSAAEQMRRATTQDNDYKTTTARQPTEVTLRLMTGPVKLLGRA